MNRFTTPEIKISMFEVNDIVTTSGETTAAIEEYITEKNIVGVANFSSAKVDDVLRFN